MASCCDPRPLEDHQNHQLASVHPSSEDQSTATPGQLVSRRSDWFVGQTWIIYFKSLETWMCLLLLYIMFRHSVNYVFWLNEETFWINSFPVLPRLFSCDGGCISLLGSAVYFGPVQSWWLWIGTEICLNLNVPCDKVLDYHHAIKCVYVKVTVCFTAFMWNHTFQSNIVSDKYLLWEKWDHKHTGIILFLRNFIKNQQKKQKTCTQIHTPTHTHKAVSIQKQVFCILTTFTHQDQSLQTYRNPKLSC